MMASFDVVRDVGRLRWAAVRGGCDLGQALVRRRPDRRAFVAIDAPVAAFGPLLDAIARDVEGPLYVAVDVADAEELAALASLGFVPVRHESDYVMDVETALAGLGDATLPSGYSLENVEDVDEDELRQLDDLLRQDVPGTDGWEWDKAGFREETYDAAQFDPQLYWLAVEGASGERVGLVRVWNRPDAARLGLIAVVARHRRRGISRGLLGQVFRILAARGVGEVVMAIDDTNHGSRGLLGGRGARQMGGSVELIGTTATSQSE